MADGSDEARTLEGGEGSAEAANEVLNDLVAEGDLIALEEGEADATEATEPEAETEDGPE